MIELFENDIKDDYLYIDVRYAFIQKIKNIGGKWCQNRKLWYIDTITVNIDELKKVSETTDDDRVFILRFPKYMYFHHNIITDASKKLLLESLDKQHVINLVTMKQNNFVKPKYCIYCGGGLVTVGHKRKNGKNHFDWINRNSHKQCFKDSLKYYNCGRYNTKTGKYIPSQYEEFLHILELDKQLQKFMKHFNIKI